MSVRDAILRTTRQVLALTDHHAEQLLVDDRVAPAPVAFRGIVDRTHVAEPIDGGGELLVQRITVTAALGGSTGLPGVPLPGRWRVQLAVDVGGAPTWCRVGTILSQDDAAVSFEVIR